MQSSPLPCYPTFRPKCQPQHTVLEHTQPTMRVTKFHMHTKQGDNLQPCVFNPGILTIQFCTDIKHTLLDRKREDRSGRTLAGRSSLNFFMHAVFGLLLSFPSVWTLPHVRGRRLILTFRHRASSILGQAFHYLIFAWPCIIDINNIDNQLDATITAY